MGAAAGCLSGCCASAVELNPDGNPKDAKALRHSARAADWQQMRMLLRRMPLRDICSGAAKAEGPDEDIGNTALHFSVSINHLRAVKKLLRYGMLASVRNKAGKTPLHIAIETGKVKASRIILEHSQYSQTLKTPLKLMDIRDAGGVTPLLAVVAAGRLKLTREVLALCKELRLDVDYDQRDKRGNSLLLYAAKWGWFDELDAWLGHVKTPQVVLNVLNKQGETVLGHVLHFMASDLLSKTRGGALVTKLIEQGALAQLPAFQERVPPVNLVAAADDMAIYQLLLSKGVRPGSSKDALGRTPLHWAAAKGSRLVAVDLLDCGLKVYARDKHSNTPLHLAAMRGQEALVQLLLEKTDDKIKALLTPNKSGLSAYHLALKAGPSDKAQSNSLALIETLGEQFTTPVIGRNKAVTDTPLMLAIQGHQERVVRAMLQKGLSPNEANVRGELPLARVMASATASTYDQDADIFGQLMEAGAEMQGAGSTTHPLLAVCKNPFSKFAEMSVGVLTRHYGGTLDWDQRDDKGYTPLALAAFHDNAWLVRHLIDVVKVDPNDASQRSSSTAPVVVGTTGSLCCTVPLMEQGTVEGQTPLMCAAKGASVSAIQLLLNREANVRAVDSLGRTALQHAMHMDTTASLLVAAALLEAGARPEEGVSRSGKAPWKQCIDLVGESWAHRAVRYGRSDFLHLWASCGGSLLLLASTDDAADDMPGSELTMEEKGDFLDLVPRGVQNVLEEDDEEMVDDYHGEDSEKVGEEEDKEGGSALSATNGGTEAFVSAAKAVGEGAEQDASSDDDCAEDEDMATLIASGQVESHYAGPTPNMLLRWRRRGARWWDEFWVDRDALPDLELEDDPGWADKYELCDEGDEWIDEEDVEDEIWESINAEQRKAANHKRAQQREQQQLHDEYDSDAASSTSPPAADEGGAAAAAAPIPQSLLDKISSGVAHKLFKRRLPNAVIPDAADLDDGTFATGSPSKWLRRKSGSSLAQPGSAWPHASGRSAGEPASPEAAGAAGQAAGGFRLQPGAAGPVAEAREEEGYRLLLEDVEDSAQDVSVGQQRDAADEQSAFLLDNYDRSDLERSRLTKSLCVTTRTPSATEGAQAVGNKSFRASMRLTAGKLMAGVHGEKLWANEPYYWPDNVFNGLPRYMDHKRTVKQPDSISQQHLDDFAAREKSYVLKDDVPLEGAELRARNIQFYHKSMSPVEYPLKIGKWTTFLRLSAKATEKARQRRPCKPGEKPKIRSKKAWFGLAELPSRPELALTSPLVYAVRLGRPKCVAALLQHNAALPNMPDAHGHTPLAYAMFQLAKDRHSKALQAITDMLLAVRPLVDQATIWRLQILPRMRKELVALEAEAAAKGDEGMRGREKRALQSKRQMVTFLGAKYEANDFPTVMDPVVLAALLGDVGRLTVMLRDCGGNINNAWVWLPDIPTYFQGLWEKQLARCRSRCTPLHVAICAKKHDLVKYDVGGSSGAWGGRAGAAARQRVAVKGRSLLDLGSDPNLCGTEFSGNTSKDLAKRAKLFRDKAEEVAQIKKMANGSNPYRKLWLDKQASMFSLLIGAKKFISTLEIPGLTRPHPYLSPLHLSCRLGLAEITFLLIQRGAAVSGGSAAAFAPKTPLEEAMQYARANAQSYGTTSDRFNYYHMLETVYLEVPPEKEAEVEEAWAWHRDTKASMVAGIQAKAQLLADMGPKDKNGCNKTKPSDYLKQANQIINSGGSLADYSPDKLMLLPLPPMNAMAAARKGMKLVTDAFDLMDPLSASMKAVSLAAKIILRVYLACIKRPIALFDPAIACAHVMLYHRAPVNPADKQTSILMRDILENGNGLEYDNCDKRLSYYRWLGIEPEDVNDTAWVSSAINKVSVLKANVKYGYMTLDLTKDWQEYTKVKKKFLGQVQATFLHTGTASVMPQYLKSLIEEGVKDLSGPDGNGDGRPGGSMDKALEGLITEYVNDGIARLKDLYTKYGTFCKAHQDEGARSDWVNRNCHGVPPEAPTQTSRDKLARGLLPGWLYSDGEQAEGTGPEAAVPRDEKGVIALLVSRFLQYDPATSRAQQYREPPLGPSPLEQLLDPEKPHVIEFKWPEISEAAIDELKPNVTDVTDADVCSAVVRACNARRTRAAHELSTKLKDESKALADQAQQRYVQRMAADAEARKGLMDKRGVVCSQPRKFDEGPIFVAAMEDPMWEAAVHKLGGSAAAKALAARLRAAQASKLIPSIANPLEFVKGLGDKALEQGQAALFEKIEAQIKQPLPSELRSQLAKHVPDAGNEARPQGGGAGNEARPQGDDADAPDADEAIDNAIEKTVQVFEQAKEAVEDPMAYLKDNAPGSELLGTLQEAWRTGELPPIPDPEELGELLVNGICDKGPGAVLDVIERKTGVQLPSAVREEIQKNAEAFAALVKERYEEGGMDAALSACTQLTDFAMSAFEGVVDAAGDKVEALEDQAEQVLDATAAAMDGDFMGAVDLLADKTGGWLPIPKSLKGAAAPLTAMAKEINEVLKSMADTSKLLQDNIKALTGDACGEMEELTSHLADVSENVYGVLDEALTEASDQFMAALEMMNEVDTQALVEAMESVREVLDYILETLSLDRDN
ncbi:Ankyrin-1 [Tetrabaena socialis]|uniref:Ankyrin-1 n=1 Tax=Tetrabaena socialis TaxID=47790 RepID=A0A2J8AF16_9CHLO|nr:Ankyrin-1 [Tetrabaena socialis]|eukprot:PNH11118.1 Ankyrin-1 [Tetrabaena socialis]